MDDVTSSGIDFSRLHAEIDRLKAQLCHCRHEGTCIACGGFEMLRQQAQMVVAAASQPVLMQVAQEASAKDLMERMGGFQEKLAGKIQGDPQLQELMARVIDRIQDDLGGPEEMEQLLKSFGVFGPGNEPGTDSHPIAPEDRPPPSRP